MKRKSLTKAIILFFVFFLLTLGVYGQFVNHFFFSDDFVWIYHGELAVADVMQIFRIRVTSFFSPVVNAYFYLGQTLFPNNHVAYHVLQLLLHALNTCLVYVFAKRILNQRAAAFAGAVYFLVSAYHFEAVIWISAVMHVLVTFFVLAGLLLYERFLVTRKVLYVLLSLACGALAFFTKENGIIVAPLIAGAYFLIQRDRPGAIRNWGHLFWYALMCVYFVVYTYAHQSSSLWVQRGVYRLEGGAVYQLAVSLLGLADVNLALHMRTHAVWLGVCGVLVLLFIAYQWRVHREQSRMLLFGVWCMVLGFLPVIFFYFGTWRSLSAFRYAYLPSIGAAFVVAFLYRAYRRWYFRKKFPFIVGVLALVCAGWFIHRNVSYIRAQYAGEYTIIQRQMRGMLEGFLEHERVLTPHRNIILAGGYPFLGNEYYRHMYRYFVDPSNTKSLDDWQSIPDKRTALERFGGLPEYVLLEWSDKELTVRPVAEPPAK